MCWCLRQSASGAAAGSLHRLVHNRRVQARLRNPAARLSDPGRQLFPPGLRRRLPQLRVRLPAQQDSQWLSALGQPHLIAAGHLLGQLAKDRPGFLHAHEPFHEHQLTLS